MALVDWKKLHGGPFSGVRCVVTGGAGFIGSHLSEALLELDADVVAVDDLSRGQSSNVGYLENLAPQNNGRFTFAKASITEAVTLGRLVENATFVFHQAAWGSVPNSVEDPRGYYAVNTTGTMNVLEAARSAGTKRVIFAASSSAYGDSPTLPKIETMPTMPRSPYAANKVAGEAMMRAWACSYGHAKQTPGDQGGFDTVCLRYFNIFGPRQNANSAYAAVIAAFARALLQGHRPLIYGDGEQSRDFTFVDNAVHANLLAARCSETLGGEVMNIACGGAVTVNQLAETMAARLGVPELSPEYRDERPGDVKHSLANLDRAAELIGYRPVVDFVTGLGSTVDWYAAEHAVGVEASPGRAE
ncbi:MAG: NAD-dependent epimerase/dehydratase family protein [Planctomycetota bacterium]